MLEKLIEFDLVRPICFSRGPLETEEKLYKTFEGS